MEECFNVYETLMEQILYRKKRGDEIHSKGGIRLYKFQGVILNIIHSFFGCGMRNN